MLKGEIKKKSIKKDKKKDLSQPTKPITWVTRLIQPYKK